MDLQNSLRILQITFLYFLPGLLFLFSLHFIRKPLANFLGISSWLTQMILVEIVLFGSMIGILIYFKVSLEELNLTRPKWYFIIFIAPVYGEIAARLTKAYRRKYGEQVTKKLNSFSLFHIPPWHYQTIAPPIYPKAMSLLLMILLQSSNLIVEEIYFRGFLFKQTAMTFGYLNWVFNGSLFILYHIFQASKTYALFPIGLFIAGYYALTADLYGCIIVHYFLNSRISVSE